MIVPQYLYHDPTIKNKYGEYIFDIYISKHLVPPKELCNKPDM